MGLQHSSEHSGASADSGNRRRRHQSLPVFERFVHSHCHGSRDIVIETGSDAGNPHFLLIPALTRVKRKQKGIRALVIASTTDRVGAAGNGQSRLEPHFGDGVRVAVLDSGDATRKEADVLNGRPGIVVATGSRIIDHLRRENIDLSSVHTVVVDEPERDVAGAFNLDLQFILSKITGRPFIVAFSPHLHEELDTVLSLLRRPRVIEQEFWQSSRLPRSRTRKEPQMSPQEKKKSLPAEEQIQDRIAEILRLIHDEADPDELNYLRKMVRKHVPLFSRGYFAAYLLRHSTAKGAGKTGTPKDGEFASIFIGVGKNRRVFPRDLIQLFGTVDSVSAEDIGEIKILDNYSFAEITSGKADQVIAKLDGTEYRGRKLNVNFARRRD
ncbi:MAG: DbpA RNA binding domain-containing protein [Spirochaetaceae bacterium]